MPPQKRRVLDTPLSPSVLEEINVVTSFPTCGAFDPDGEWTHTYLVWTCHGYDAGGNFDAGYLTIRRWPTGDGGIMLDVTTEIALLDGLGARTAARIQCRADDLTTPESWMLDSTYTNQFGANLPDQNARQTAAIADGRLTVTIGDREHATAVQPITTGDWCLFDAVQRLPRDGSARLSCDVLERMLALKRGQTIWYRSARPVTVAGHELTGFSRTGYASLPTEYWVDQGGRLVLVVAYNMIYLLSDSAVDAFRRAIDRQRRKYA